MLQTQLLRIEIPSRAGEASIPRSVVRQCLEESRFNHRKRVRRFAIQNGAVLRAAYSSLCVTKP